MTSSRAPMRCKNSTRPRVPAAMKGRVCSLLLTLVACAPPRAPAPPPAPPGPQAAEPAARREAERREKLARHVADFARHGRPAGGWTPPAPSPGAATHAELMAQAASMIELYNTVSAAPEEAEADFLLEIVVVFLGAESLAADPEAAFLALAQATRILKIQLERYPDTPFSPAAMVLLAACYWRLGTYDDKAARWFEAATLAHPDHPCTQLAWIALGDRLCRQGDAAAADLRFARAQQGPNPAAAALAAARAGCHNLDTPLAPGFYSEYRAPRRWRDPLCR